MVTIRQKGGIRQNKNVKKTTKGRTEIIWRRQKENQWENKLNIDRKNKEQIFNEQISD